MGEVWKALDTRLNRVVAIKRLKGNHSERFQQEARTIAALNHPHICQIHDVGPDYLVLEYIEGKPLQGPFPVEEATRLAIEIAGALEEAHQRGILHRDLKPANILVTEKGAAKLLDFGLAKLLTRAEGDLTQTLEGTVLGTAPYMAPEQAEGKPLDERSDIFSFGAVLYEMLSGSRAFGGNSTAQVLSAILRDEPPPLAAPPELDRIVRRCLAKLPAQRFQKMAELRAALQRLSTHPAEPQPSIAVLPFADMSPARDHEWFSDGLTEEIINALTQIPGLKVIARTSAFAFKGKHEDIRRIAEALGVAHILEGSVRKAGNRIRVTAQLITAADGSHLWSERYDREMADVFDIQDEIAQAIVTVLRTKLSTQPAGPARYIPNLSAYEALLKARFYLQKLTPEALVRSRDYYEQAIALDPKFAQAHCEFGWHYFMLATENLMPVLQAALAMREEARKALDIDPSLPDAHAVLGVAAVIDYDWTEAGRQFALTLAREPIPPLVRYFYALFYLAPLGRIEEALEQIQRALEEDPLNVLFRTTVGMLLLGTGRGVDGEAALRQVMELDPNAWIPCLWLGPHFLAQGKIDEALALAERAYTLVPRNWGAIGLLARILELTGDRSRADELHQKIGSGEAYGAPAGLFFYYAIRSELDLAADWFEKAIEQRDTRAPWILPHLFGTFVTSSSRWPDLRRRMNLPETV